MKIRGQKFFPPLDYNNGSRKKGLSMFLVLVVNFLVVTFCLLIMFTYCKSLFWVQRTILLKFLCDELLNSALIHQHLEHCVELSADLQPKLRSTTVELRNLKYKEETLAANVAKTDNYPPFSSSEEKSAGKNQNTESLDAEDRCTDVQAAVEGSQFSGNASSPMTNLEKDKSFRQNELLHSNVLQ